MVASERHAGQSMGAVRLISIDETSGNVRPQNGQTIEKYVTRFLENHVSAPYQFKQFSAHSFAIHGPGTEESLKTYVIALHRQLKDFLFGASSDTSEDALSFAGPDADVAQFLTEPADKARARSEAFEAEEERKQHALNGSMMGEAREVEADTHPLLFRGVMECQHSALFSFIITPRSTKSYLSDANPAHFIDALGPNAIDYEIHAFEAASHFLKDAAKKHMNVMFQLPLSYRTLLSSRRKTAYINALKQHPVWVRDQMFLSIVGAPTSPHSGVIQRYVSEFRPWFRFLDWRVTNPKFIVENLTVPKLHSVTLELQQTEKNREQKISAFIKRVAPLKRARVRAGVTGLSNGYELVQAIAGGIRYASGDAITAPLSHYRAAVKINAANLPLGDMADAAPEDIVSLAG